LASLLVLLISPATLAQMPQLLAKNPDDPADKPHPVAIAKADVSLMAAGRLCQTTVTLTFRNDADRVLEGDLVFPLPENATVSGYGLDVNGQLVDAVTIEKEKARVVFESETRRGIDPGIVEQVQGNNFRTRVHPIPAKGTRTIRVQYVSEPLTQGDQLLYKLPVRWPGATPELTVRIESVSAQAPKVEGLPELKWHTDGNRHVGQVNLGARAFASDVVAALPASSAPPVLVEKRTTQGEQLTKTEHYFVLNDTPAVTPETRTAVRAKPSRIAIAWDASLSRGKVDHAKELELISRHLATLGEVGVDVIVFRNVPETAKSFAVKNGDPSEVAKYLSSLAYDGGTNLSAVEFTRRVSDDKTGAKLQPMPPVGYYLLFTDGLSNLGPELPASVEAPVYAVAVDPRSNHNLLRRLSASSGGQYLNLESIDVKQALAAMTEEPYSLLSVDYDAKEIADVYPRLPQPIQGHITLAGRLLATSAKVTLNYGRGGNVMARVPVTITREGAVEGSLAPRFWAQLKLADLSASPEKNEADIVALGKGFNLVTPYTSMIVLETVEQYLRHGIVPPRSRADVYAQFIQRIERQQAVAANEERAKIDRVVAMWNGRLAWWNQEFKYAADFKYRAPPPAKPAVVAAGGVTAARGLSDGVSGSGGRAVDAAPAAIPPAQTPAPVDHAERGRAQGQVPQATGETAPQAGPTGGVEGRRAGVASGPVAQDRLQQAAGEPVDHEALIRSPQSRLAVRGTRVSLAVHDARGERPAEDAVRLKRDGSDPAGDTAGAAFGDSLGIKPWTPETPYLKALQGAAADQAYTVYLSQRKSYESSPAFYLDCADFFMKDQPDLALRILTNIPELALDDGRLLRIAAHRLQQLGQTDLAIDLFERVVKLRPEEPQSFRDLALALADRADARAETHDTDRARSDYERSLQLLHKVVMNPWQRFEEIELIALTEANRILTRAQSAIGNPQSAIHNPFDPRLVKLLDPDLRIVMTWDTDNTDIDLHVTEPSGETCVYNHNRTTIGGALSKDFTQGYGPEEYLLRHTMPGQYKIQAHFYGNRDQQLVGPTTVQATVITHYGRPDERRQSITLRLKDAKEMVDVGTIEVR
jgi:tetratricopeptide (TPR) repeat protein